jgi:hypothetical protein
MVGAGALIKLLFGLDFWHNKCAPKQVWALLDRLVTKTKLLLIYQIRYKQPRQD